MRRTDGFVSPAPEFSGRSFRPRWRLRSWAAAFLPFRSRRPSWAGIPLVPFRPGRPRLAGVALLPFRSRRSHRTDIPAIPLGSLRSLGSSVTPLTLGARRTLDARLALVAPLSRHPLRTRRADGSSLAFRTGLALQVGELFCELGHAKLDRLQPLSGRRLARGTRCGGAHLCGLALCGASFDRALGWALCHRNLLSERGIRSVQDSSRTSGDLRKTTALWESSFPTGPWRSQSPILPPASPPLRKCCRGARFNRARRYLASAGKVKTENTNAAIASRRVAVIPYARRRAGVPHGPAARRNALHSVEPSGTRHHDARTHCPHEGAPV